MYEAPTQAYSLAPWKRPIAWVTWSIMGTTIVIFLLQLWTYHREGDDIIGNTLAFSPQALADHRYWTLVTYALAHAVAMFNDPSLFWLHIVSNMIPLFCFGPALEEFLGRWLYFGLYLGGAIASALFWYLFNAHVDPYGDSDQGIIGASGAIFALIAAIGTVAPRQIVDVYVMGILPVRARLRTLALVACAIEVASILFGWLPDVAHSAHLGGAAFGFLYALVACRLLHRQIIPN